MDDCDILELDRAGFRRWLMDNHDRESQCLIVVRRYSCDEGLDYLDAVEEALCFGWIDSTVRLMDGVGRVQRFSPRRTGSRWTELNKARCERLERLGMMTDAGREAWSRSKEFSIDTDVMERLKEDPMVWDNLMSFPELYRRIRIDNIQAYRKDKDTFEFRLKKLIDNTREGRMYGKWDDDGRLS